MFQRLSVTKAVCALASNVWLSIKLYYCQSLHHACSLSSHRGMYLYFGDFIDGVIQNGIRVRIFWYPLLAMAL